MMERRSLLWRTTVLTLLLCGFFAFAEAAGLSVQSLQITLYDLSSENEEPVALGRVPLLPGERQAKLYVFSVQPDVARLPYSRDRFFVTRLRQSVQTGAVSFRVRHEQVIDKRCTALDIRDYYNVRPGETCELCSERGRIRALFRLSE